MIQISYVLAESLAKVDPRQSRYVFIILFKVFRIQFSQLLVCKLFPQTERNLAFTKRSVYS